MAIATGTHLTNTDLLNKLNTFLTTNGWTKLVGETDLACASPKAARYWRLNVTSTDRTASYDFRELELLEWRITTGGANQATDGSKYSFSSVATGTGADLVGGTGTVQSPDITRELWTVTYDFTTPTIIRELVIKADTWQYAPHDFYVQWSNDGKTWTTMVDYSALSWVADETKIFTWDTGAGYVWPEHASGTIPKRSGYSDNFNGKGDQRDTEICDDLWVWEGPGYDAARRVYVSAAPYEDTASGERSIRLITHAEYAPDEPRVTWFGNQVGRSPDVFLLSNVPGGTHWFYCNNSRFIVVIKSGVADYTSCYAGFLAAFATPDDYPFPLYVAATSDQVTDTMGVSNSGYRSMADPGELAGQVRLWDNTYYPVGNHRDLAGRDDLVVEIPAAWTWPYHVGTTDGNINSSREGVWPSTVVGNSNTYDTHWLNMIDPTDQGDLPIIPVIVQVRPFGNIGALHGVFCVPGGGVLAPEQVITISAVNYRVFTTRDYLNGHNFFMIRED